MSEDSDRYHLVIRTLRGVFSGGSVAIQDATEICGDPLSLVEARYQLAGEYFIHAAGGWAVSVSAEETTTGFKVTFDRPGIRREARVLHADEIGNASQQPNNN